jgi:predicted PurR-regulated permease PerM
MSKRVSVQATHSPSIREIAPGASDAAGQDADGVESARSGGTRLGAAAEEASSAARTPAAAPDGAAPPDQVTPGRPRYTRSIRAASWVLVSLAVAFTLYLAASLLLPILLAAMLALLLTPLVEALTRIKVPQPAAAALVVLAVLAALGALALQLAGPAQRWIDSAPAELRKIEARLRVIKRPVEAVREATDKVAEMAAVGAPKKKPPAVAVEERGVMHFLTLTQTTVVTALTTILLVYFLLASGDLFLRKLVRIIPRLRDKIRAVEIAREVQREVARYFATVTLVNIGLGVATGVAMWLLGMPTPLLWGVAIAALNFLPYIGPLIAVVMLGAVALLTFDRPLEVLAPPAVFLMLNLLEDQVVLPIVLGRRLALNPVVIFLWVLVWTWLWGVAGVLLAVPLLVAVRICTERVPALAPVAALLARE